MFLLALQLLIRKHSAMSHDTSFLVNRKIKYTILTPHNFAKVDFTIKWNIVSLQIDVMTFKINANARFGE
jgi:hypothetical protein